MNSVVSATVTIVAMIGFIGACYWAFTRKNKSKWERMGRLPMDEQQREEAEQKAQENKQ